MNSDKLIAQIEALRPPPPGPGTIEYARWLDGKKPDYAFLESILREHGPKLWDGGNKDWGLVTYLEPTPDFITGLVASVKTIPWLQDTIDQNFPRKNGKLVWPEDYDGNILRYLKDTPFLQLFNQEYFIDVPEIQRFAGTWIVAPSGKGKTTLMHNLILNDLCSPQSALILMDSKPTKDLIAPFRAYKTIQERLILIEPIEGLAINPLSIPGTSVEASISLMTYIFSSLVEAELTPLQSTLFRYALRALIESYQNPTVKDFQSIIAHGVPSDVNLRPSLREFFDKEFPTQNYRGTREQLQWRLRLLLDNPIMESMLSCPETKIDLAKEINAGKIIIINADKEKLSDIGSEFFQRFWIALILNAAQRRQKETRHVKPCWVYCDEIQTWAKNDTNLVTILDECRAAKIGIHLSHQRVDQLSPQVIDALANCAVKYANAENDAALLASLFRTKTENMRHKNLTFTLYVRDHGTTVVTAPRYGELDELLPQMSDEEWEAFAIRMLAYYQGQETEEPSTETVQNIVTNTATDIDNISTEPTKTL